MAIGARGSKFVLSFAQQSDQETQASGTFQQLPVYTLDLKPQEPLQADQVLSAGFGRDAAVPYRDQQTVTGSASIPIDSDLIGHWLKLALGPATVVGSAAPYAHTFKSGLDTLPFWSLQMGFPDIALYERYLGISANTLALDLAPTGVAQATVGLMGLSGEMDATPLPTTITPVTGYKRYLKRQASISRNGALLGKVTGGQINLTNNMTALQTIRNDNRVEANEAGLSEVSGTMTVRFADKVLIDQALADTPCAIDYGYDIDADTSIHFQIPQAYFERTGPEVSGPGGISLSMDWRGANDGTIAAMLQVVLKCQTAAF